MKVKKRKNASARSCRPPEYLSGNRAQQVFFLFFDNIDHDDNGRDDHVMIHDDPDYQG